MPTDLIIEAIKIFLEENFCEFCNKYFKVNNSTAIGPCHSCDFVDIFVGELDDALVQKLEDEEIERTEWTIFHDDRWDTLLDDQFLQEEGREEDEVTGLTRNDHGDFVRGLARENREDFIFQQR